jgi:molybdopterin synthase sulfur carrier subunit
MELRVTIKVKFFASLREQVGLDELDLSADQAGSGSRTVASVWSAACGDTAMPANTLAAVNMEYVDLAGPVLDGDEVAFFPPVTGGGR